MTSYSNILTKLDNDPSLSDYETLNKLLKDENSFISAELHSAGETFEQLLRIIQRDVNTRSSKEKEKWSQSALKALGYALHNRMLSARVTEEQSTEIIELICGIITTTKNKSMCNLAVWCISVQNLHPSVLSADEVLHALLSALRHAIEGLGATDSSSVRHEGISAIARLILQCSQAIFDEQNVSLWLPLLLLHMLDPVVKVRDKATSSVAMCMVQLSKLSKTVPEHISQCVFDALADKLLRAINDKMESNDDLIVVRTWGQIVGLLGRFILKSDLINTLLKIPSRTFTSSDAAVRVQSCQSWRYLIDNFALQPNSLLVVKRLKLLIAPVLNCLTTDKELPVKQEALKTWIYLLNKLGDHVAQNYEHVIQPCLDVICKDDDIGMRWEAFAIFANLLRPVKEQPNLAPIPIQANTAVITWSQESVQHVWRDWLAMYRHFALDDTLYQHKTQYTQQVITCFSYLTNHVEADSGLLQLIELLNELRDQIEPAVLHGAIQALLQINSVTWHGPGTPITALLTLCLALTRDTEYATLFAEAVRLLFAAPSPIDALRHLHVLMKQWTSESDGALLSAWQLIGQELHKFIEATHCVTTAPEEFEAMNHVLLVPLQLIFTDSHDSSPSSQNTAHEDKSLVALWSKLCASYVRIAAVKSQHANNAIYTLANTLTTLFHSRIVASSRGCVVLTRCITALIQSVTMPLHTQPQMGKFWRNDPTQEAQVILLLDLVACVLAVGLQHADLLSDADVSSVTALREVFDLFATVGVSDTKHVVQLVQATATLFEHVSSAVDYHLLATALAPSLASVLRAYSEQASSKTLLFGAVDELLTHFLEAAKRTHRGMYDSHLLGTLSGVLAVSLMHGKKSVKNRSVTFWCETFGAQTRALEYPHVLHPVLAQLKHVSKIKLPGWRDDVSRTEEHVHDELLPDASLGFVDLNDLQSIKGGVQRLKKSDTSNGPAVKSSAAPFKRPESRVLQESDALNRERTAENGDAVTSNNKRKRPLLTERQRESMKERSSYVPVTYTAVDASQSGDDALDENEEPAKKKQKTSHATVRDHREWMQALDALFDESALQGMNSAQLSEVQNKLATYLGRVAFKLTIK